MTEENVAAEATEPTTTEGPQSLHEALEAAYDKVNGQADATEAAAAEKPEAAETPEKVEPADAEQKTTEEPPPAPEKLALTAEQLADTKYWGGLDADGWQRMERDYPVETRLVKAAQAAASRIVNGARKDAPQPAVETRTEASSDDEPSAELLQAVEESQSLDPIVAARGYLKIQKLTVPIVMKEQGFDPERGKADIQLQEAFRSAAAELPELTTFNLTELDAIVESSRTLMALVRTGTTENIAEAMIGAGQILSDRKKAAAANDAATRAQADAKKKESQRQVRSNARPASADVLSPHGANPAARLSFREKLSETYDQVASKLNGNS